ncbi:unnamed protein product, partial [Symbiodinium microadriaticum]
HARIRFLRGVRCRERRRHWAPPARKVPRPCHQERHARAGESRFQRGISGGWLASFPGALHQWQPHVVLRLRVRGLRGGRNQGFR